MFKRTKAKHKIKIKTAIIKIIINTTIIKSKTIIKEIGNTKTKNTNKIHNHKKMSANKDNTIQILWKKVILS